MLYWIILIFQVLLYTHNYLNEMIIEVVTRELPAWTMFLLVTGTRILFAVTAPPLFIATTRIAYWIYKLNSITSKTNSNRKRRRSKRKTEACKETKMILSCVMLSNWFCHMHIKVDFDLLLDSITMQTAFNFSSHVFTKLHMKFGSHHQKNHLTDTLPVFSFALSCKEYICLCSFKGFGRSSRSSVQPMMVRQQRRNRQIDSAYLDAIPLGRYQRQSWKPSPEK